MGILSRWTTDLHSDPFGHLKPVDHRSVKNPVGHQHFHHLFIDAFSIELDLISVVSNPKGEIKRPLPESAVDAF